MSLIKGDIMKIKENSAVKKIIKMPVGYTILTISDNYDLKRIAIKGSVSKGRRYIYMYDKDTDLVNSIDAEVKISNENGLKIEFNGSYRFAFKDIRYNIQFALDDEFKIMGFGKIILNTTK